MDTMQLYDHVLLLRFTRQHHDILCRKDDVGVWIQTVLDARCGRGGALSSLREHHNTVSVLNSSAFQVRTHSFVTEHTMHLDSVDNGG